MNERRENAANIEDEHLVTRAKELFDQSVDCLDAETRSRLNRSRHEALAQAEPGVRYGQWVQWAPTAGITAAVLLAVVILDGKAPVDKLTPPATAGDFEILLMEESFEMLEELEFYSWIDLETELDDVESTNGNVG